MHQNQWLAAIKELEEDGLESTPAPQSFPQEREKSEFAYQVWNCSEGTESEQGRWAKGPSVDGKGEIEYLAAPKPMGETVTELAPIDPAFTARRRSRNHRRRHDLTPHRAARVGERKGGAHRLQPVGVAQMRRIHFEALAALQADDFIRRDGAATWNSGVLRLAQGQTLPQRLPHVSSATAQRTVFDQLRRFPHGIGTAELTERVMVEKGRDTAGSKLRGTVMHKVGNLLWRLRNRAQVAGKVDGVMNVWRLPSASPASAHPSSY